MYAFQIFEPEACKGYKSSHIMNEYYDAESDIGML